MDDGKNILFDPDSIPRSGASVGIDFRRFPKTGSHHVVTGHEGQPGYLRVVVRGRIRLNVPADTLTFPTHSSTKSSMAFSRSPSGMPFSVFAISSSLQPAFNARGRMLHPLAGAMGECACAQDNHFLVFVAWFACRETGSGGNVSFGRTGRYRQGADEAGQEPCVLFFLFIAHEADAGKADSGHVFSKMTISRQCQATIPDEWNSIPFSKWRVRFSGYFRPLADGRFLFDATITGNSATDFVPVSGRRDSPCFDEQEKAFSFHVNKLV